MKEIKLTQGQVAIVDDEDFKLISEYKWFAIKKPSTHYAVRSTSRTTGEKRENIYLHWDIIGKPKKGMVVDHINGNGLDNRKENLRFVTRRQNMQNRHIITNSSKYPGVSWHDSNQKWQARIRIGDKEKYLGVFATEKAAFTAYKEAVNLIGEQVIDFDYRDERQPCSLN